MKFGTTHFIALLIGAALGSGAVYAWTVNQDQGGSKPAQTALEQSATAQDGRIALYLTPYEQAHIREEMLTFLTGVQKLSAAIVEEDRTLIAKVAGELSQGAGTDAGRAVSRKSPDGFRHLGRTLRADLAAIASLAETAPLPDIQQSLADSMNNCVACHGSYTIVQVSDITEARP